MEIRLFAYNSKARPLLVRLADKREFVRRKSTAGLQQGDTGAVAVLQDMFVCNCLKFEPNPTHLTIINAGSGKNTEYHTLRIAKSSHAICSQTCSMGCSVRYPVTC